MTVARSLPRSLAPVVEQLELDQPRVVTVHDIADILADIGTAGAVSDADRVPAARVVAYQLQRRGWFGKLATRDVWEFQPAARAGAFGSGDRLIELRAQLATRPNSPLVLAMDSAAAMLGLAQHIPDSEVIAAPHGVARPKALRGWRIVRIEFARAAIEAVDDLPVWTLEALLTGVATRPSAYRDLAGLGQWLPLCGDRIDPARLDTCLHDVNAATRQRVIYLLNAAGRHDLADDLARRHPPRDTVWFSSRKPGGRHDATARVVDADLAPYLTGGTGA